MSKPAFTDIVPTRDGVLQLEPTPKLRWIDCPEIGRINVLQQLWRDKETGAPYWRDVPTVTGKRT